MHVPHIVESPPPDARVAWHRLVMSSIYMDSVHKKQLAISLAANYTQLQKNFVADSHDHDVCVSNTFTGVGLGYNC